MELYIPARTASVLREVKKPAPVAVENPTEAVPEVTEAPAEAPKKPTRPRKSTKKTPDAE